MHEWHLRLTEIVCGASEGTFDALGYRFSLSGKDSGRLADAHALLCGLATNAPAKHAITVPSGTSTRAVLDATVGSVNFAALQAGAGNLLLHAGGVCRADGTVLALCAPSGGGKSTLTARLVERGYGYVTDETLCIDAETMRNTPFRKPISLKAGSQKLFARLRPAWAEDGQAWLIPAEQVGGAAPLPTRLFPGAVVFPQYRRGERLSVERIGQAEAAFLLGQQASRLGLVRGGPLPALARLTRRAPAYRVVHGDVDVAADAVTRLWDRL